jgi:hypothetical protein
MLREGAYAAGFNSGNSRSVDFANAVEQTMTREAYLMPLSRRWPRAAVGPNLAGRRQHLSRP